MSMNVLVMRRTTVTPMPCAPTLKDPMSVDAFVDLRAMVETAQVFFFSVLNNVLVSEDMVDHRSYIHSLSSSEIKGLNGI